ncbi:hypothetical protein HDU76_010078, partial [Blyttiomyces sp. JEL0837]
KKKSKKSKKKKSKKSKKSKKGGDSSTDDDGVRYSSITGKKLKMKITKSRQDKMDDINRQELRRMLNQIYE